MRLDPEGRERFGGKGDGIADREKGDGSQEEGHFATFRRLK